MRKIDKTLLVLAMASSPVLGHADAAFLSAVSGPLFAEGPVRVTPKFMPGKGTGVYAVNFPLQQDYTRGDRHLDGVLLKGSSVGDQKWDIPAPRKVYTQGLTQVFLAKAGETLIPQFNFKGNWMNGFVYIDFDNDGKFQAVVHPDGTVAAESDLVAYSNYKKKNSEGKSSGNGNVLNPPSFTLPANLAPGIYRMRYKVDWDDIQAGGHADILKNGGAICDVLLLVHGDNCQVSAVGSTVTAADGSALENTVLPFAQDLKIKVVPSTDETQEFVRLRIRHGYRLSGEAVVNGNPQYQEHYLSASVLAANDGVIPGKFLDGEVEIEAEYAPKGIYTTHVAEGEEYTRTDRHLDGVGLTRGGQQQMISIPAPRKVYTKLLGQYLQAKAGEEVTPKFQYSSDWMNGYVYLDRNNDGVFQAELDAEGHIPAQSDIMAFSHYQGKDSQGKTTNGGLVNPPSFTVPADLVPGFYRMRYKVDWDFLDPAGRTGDKDNMMANGGALCDVLLNVHGDFCQVETVTDPQVKVLTVEGKELSRAEVPFGQPLTLQLQLAEGTVCEAVQVRHGYHLEGPAEILGNPQYQDDVIPAYLFTGNEVTIPAAFMDGEVRIQPVVAKGNAVAGEDYALNFEPETVRGQVDPLLNKFTLAAAQGGTTTIELSSDKNLVYRNFAPQSVSVLPGDPVNVQLDWNGTPGHAYLYVDLNQDGQFGVSKTEDGKVGPFSELVSYTAEQGKNSAGASVAEGDAANSSLPVFQIPADLPVGNYRARLKVDVENLDAAGSSEIAQAGGHVIDFLLNVHRPTQKLNLLTTNGNVYGPDATALPLELTPYTALDLVPTPVFEGYEAEKMRIKIGHRFDGPQYVHGNRQWNEYEVPAAPYTIPAAELDGDVAVSVHYEKGENAAYELVFSDEFNGENGTQPDERKWMRSPRQGATWNRWISNSEEVVYLKDGNLVTRAIPNPDKTSDPVPMITGAIQSQGKFGFKYGKVECRAKANVWKGTFPAIWLMPVDQKDGWPTCGEIDIFETIDNDHKAYHTIHTHWTFDLKHGPNGSNVPAQHDRYHTYGFEWNATALKFFVDGKQVWTYHKSDKQNELNQGQWPFDKQFYLILNQSVGNHNVWASYPDEDHTYEFLVDWIRVYQKPGMENSDGLVGLTELNAEQALEVEVVNRGLRLQASVPVRVCLSDLTGRVLYTHLLHGEREIALSPGLYVVNGKKYLVR